MPEIDELEKKIKEKDRQIEELQKINFDSQNLLKKLLMSDDPEIKRKTRLELEKEKEIKKIKATLEKKEKVIEDLKQEFEKFKKEKLVEATKDAQAKIMKSAVSKIKAIQKVLEEKNEELIDLRKTVKDWNRKYSDLVVRNEEELFEKEREIEKLEKEFISFKEEFVSELKNIERDEEIIKNAQLQAEITKLQKENEKLNKKLTTLQEKINTLESTIKSKDEGIKALEAKLDAKEQTLNALLLAKDSNEDLQQGLQEMRKELERDLEIRMQELEGTRQDIIYCCTELARIPNLSDDEIEDYLDDLLLISTKEERLAEIEKIRRLRTGEPMETEIETIPNETSQPLKNELLAQKEQLTHVATQSSHDDGTVLSGNAEVDAELKQLDNELDQLLETTESKEKVTIENEPLLKPSEILAQIQGVRDLPQHKSEKKDEEEPELLTNAPYPSPAVKKEDHRELLKPVESEEPEEELLTNKPLFEIAKEEESSNTKEAELLAQIKERIPEIGDDEAETLMRDLIDEIPSIQKEKIEFYRMTKQIESN